MLCGILSIPHDIVMNLNNVVGKKESLIPLLMMCTYFCYHALATYMFKIGWQLHILQWCSFLALTKGVIVIN